MTRWRPWAAITAFVCIAGCMVGRLAPAGQFSAATVLQELAWIEQQAALVNSAQAEFTVTYQPTTQVEMQRIAALCKQRGNEYRAGSYYTSLRRARRQSYHSTWFRKGALEREERIYIARPAIVETTVFDGRTVRTLDATPGRSCLYITSPAANWTHKHRIQPFAFAFEFRSQAHGVLVRESPERHFARSRPSRAEIVARHPTEEPLILRMVFDAQHRLTAREAILTEPSSHMELDFDEPAVYARHEFSNYESYDVGRGRRIWFPSKAVLRYYLGKLLDGTPVERQVIEVEVRHMEFNVPLADTKFAIEAPDGIPVYDRRREDFQAIAVSY